MFEGVLMCRKWALVLIAFFVDDAFQATLTSLGVSVVVFFGVIRWRPYATEGGQVEASVANVVLVILQLLMLARASGRTTNLPMDTLDGFWLVAFVATLGVLLFGALVRWSLCCLVLLVLHLVANAVRPVRCSVCPLVSHRAR